MINNNSNLAQQVKKLPTPLHNYNQGNISKVRQKLHHKKVQIDGLEKKINQQIENYKQEEQNMAKKNKQMQLYVRQKRVDLFPQQISNIQNENEEDQIQYSKQKDLFVGQKQFQVDILSSAVFYPPACAAFDLAYCKNNSTIYAYGGISCTTELKEGIRQYFYKYSEGQWKEIKSSSIFTPVPRYGHTLSGINDYLLLFGGVSQYKQKLKDRCFYSDVWAFNINTHSWKIMQFSGPTIRNRKSHAACTYNKFYIVSGGIDDSEEVISEISWVNVDEKKGKWRSKKMQGRFNHQIAVCQSIQGRDYLFVFGGRNAQSQIISDLVIYPIHVSQGELQFKQPTRVCQQLIPCQFPIMKTLQNGILIVGGIDANNEAIQQCWYYNVDKLSLEMVESKTEWKQLRGAKGVSLNGRAVYILSGSNSKKYKAVRISFGQSNDDQFSSFKFS